METYKDKILTLVNSIIDDDELTEHDKISIIRSGIMVINQKMYKIKVSYRDSEYANEIPKAKPKAVNDRSLEGWADIILNR